MDIQEQLAALLDLAESLGMQIRHAPAGRDGGDHPGGAMVRLKGREILFLDDTAAPADQVAVLAAALANKKELQDVFLPPEIRQILDESQ